MKDHSTAFKAAYFAVQEISVPGIAGETGRGKGGGNH